MTQRIRLFIKKCSSILHDPRRPNGQFLGSRSRIALFGFFLIYLALIFRATVITLIPQSAQRLKEIADQQYQRDVELSPYRGFILDRRGEPLAISILKSSAYINPRIFNPDRKQTRELAKILKRSSAWVRHWTKKKSYFAWLDRHLSNSSVEKLQALNIEGLHFRKEPGRYYPGSQVAANLIGKVGIDYKGLTGLERFFEKTLRGESARLTANVDARAKPIYLSSDIASPQRPGNNIHLTIDRAIQEIAEEAISQGVKKARAKSGFAVVLDPHTGQILALANYPTFNPNAKKILKMEHTKNFALQDAYEPGSTLKPLVIAAALEAKKTSPQEMHSCENGSLRIDRSSIIRDDHPKAFLSTTETLVYSSNICTFKIAQRLGPQMLYDSLLNFGLGGNSPGLGFPGEAKGSISNPKNWKLIRFANIAFGQGLMASPLEIVEAYAAFANGGILLKPYIISKITSPEGQIISTFQSEKTRAVMSSQTAKHMRQMLELVVTEGTGKNAATEDYSVAGKTGTAEKVDAALKAYSKTKRFASFAGFAPASDPHIVVFVGVDEPANKPYYGSTWAAPVFSTIVSSTLKYLNVPPDKVKNDNTLEISYGTPKSKL